MFLDNPLQSLNLITLHLGNGGSVTAIRQSESVDTSMGMTPLEGLVMGTRSGDIDPAIPFYLNQNRSMSSVAIDTMLNKESGLKGICGENDMRAVHRMADAGDENAQHEERDVDIRKKGTAVGVLVIPTNEELEIAIQSMECVQRKV
jgi:acetate kinase